jgi:hypothetical protein
MKKAILSFRVPVAAAFIVLLLSATPALGQRYFQGNIVYNINYSGSRIDLAEQEQLPKTLRVTARNNMARSEMKAGVLKQIKISDAQKQKFSTLLEIENGFYHIETPSKKLREQLSEMPAVELIYTDEYQTILGYRCRKVLAVTQEANGSKHTAEIFYTDAYKGSTFNFDMPYKEVPGLMLKYQIKVGNLIMNYEAVSIDKKKNIRARVFNIPKNYQLTSFEELKDKLSTEN